MHRLFFGVSVSSFAFCFLREFVFQFIYIFLLSPPLFFFKYCCSSLPPLFWLIGSLAAMMCDAGLGGGLNKCGRMLIPFPAEPDWNAGGKSTLEPAEDGCNKGADSYWDKVVTDADGSADFGQCMDIQSQHTDRQEADLMYVRTTCGSNWDRWGNRRFKNEAVHISGHFQEGTSLCHTLPYPTLP